MEIKKDNQISSNPKSPRAFDDLNAYEQRSYKYPSAIVVSYGCAIDYIIVEYPDGALPKHGHAQGGEFVERLSFNPGEYITGIEAETGIYKENGILHSVKFNTSQNRQLGIQAKPSGFYTKSGEQKIVLEKGEAVACFYGSTARANDDHSSDGYLSALGIYTRGYVDTFALNDHCMGFSEKKDNCWNYSIIAKDPTADIFRNEYYAGFIQGKLQGADTIIAARNNVWNNTYLIDTSPAEDKFPHDFDPTEEELEKAGDCLLRNYTYLYGWVKDKSGEGNPIAVNIKRLLFRLLGINDGITYKEPQKDTSFEKMNPEKMNPLELKLGYRIQQPSFMDLYLINAQSDLFDALTSSKESHRGLYKADRCSAFVKRTTDKKGNKDICWTHNTWAGFLCQSLTISYAIGDDFVSQNSYCQGQVGSNTDFGFNGHGICFNETTHRNGCIRPKVEGIWMCWRAAAAEMFARSIDDFCHYLSVDNTSTYLNGYMLIDANTNETALIEMSYKRFVTFRSNGDELTVTDSTGVSEPEYDRELISAEYIFGINYPISYQVVKDLASTDNRPMRRIQFKDRIDGVEDMESAKALITYVGKDAEGKEEPLSIFGRWDLGYGTTEYPKTIPDGAVDSKVFSANAVRALLSDLKFIPNKDSDKSSFLMLYGTPPINGKPFIWSESEWYEFKKRQDKDLVPDRLEGAWNETKLFMD